MIGDTVYILKETASDEVIQKLTAKDDLLSVMLDIENYFDNANLYTFNNWFSGELVDGPIVKKYWIEITLKYPYKKMPDPRGGLRLTPHGTKIDYRKAYELVPQPINSPSDYEPGTKKPKMKHEPIWLIHMRIPRRFVDALEQEMLDIYADEVEGEEVEDTETNNAGGAGGGLTGGTQL